MFQGLCLRLPHFLGINAYMFVRGRSVGQNGGKDYDTHREKMGVGSSRRSSRRVLTFVTLPGSSMGGSLTTHIIKMPVVMPHRTLQYETGPRTDKEMHCAASRCPSILQIRLQSLHLKLPRNAVPLPPTRRLVHTVSSQRRVAVCAGAESARRGSPLGVSATAHRERES